MANISQSHFRFGKEELLEATHGWWQNEDVNHTQLITADWTFLLRFCEQVTTAVLNVDAQFQYNKNAAGWVNITTSSAVVKAVPSVAFTDAANCTKRLSGTGTFETSGAGCTEDGLSGGNANDIQLNGNSETEAGLQVVAADVANGDTIQFRLTSPDGTMVYTVTPTLTIQKAVYEYGVATLSGLGTLVGSGRRILKSTATLSGAGLVAAIGTVISGAVYEYGAAMLSGAGSLVSAASRIRRGTGNLAGSGLISAIGVLIFGAKITLSGSGALSGIGGRLRSGVVTLSGLGNLTGQAVKTVAGKVVLAGTGLLVAVGNFVGEGVQTTMSGVGTLSVIGRRIYKGILVNNKIRRHYAPADPPI